MASNQYGPAASFSTPSRQPRTFAQSDNYKTPQQSQWGPSNSQASPFRDRDSDSASPELHPGMGPAYDSSSSRSGGSYGQPSANNFGQYGPSAATRIAGASYTPDNRSQDFGNYGGYSSPRGMYQNPSYNQSSQASHSSADQLTAGAAPLPMSGRGNVTPGSRGYMSSSNNYGPPAGPYRNPYDNHSISRNNFNGLEYVNPNEVIDDGDDGLGYKQAKRRSVISLHRQSRGSTSALGAGAVTGLAAATAANGSGSAFASKNPSGNDLDRGIYGEQTTPAGATEKTPAVFAAVIDREKDAKRRKCKKISFIILGVVILCAIVGGVVAAVLISKKNDDKGGGSNSSASAGDSSPAGTLDKNSNSVKSLLNNPKLHKVFTGMAYTPLNTQYPDCLTNPPTQNNITLDMAVLSQLTNTVRMYGTDCQQTELVLTAIDKLGLTDMKVWVGVYLNNNQTTNDRQVNQLWNILDKYGTKYVKGIIVGNEVLFRKDMTATQLKQYITNVRSNMTSRSINVPIASADLGDNWTSDLASAVDTVMANVHPFFAGIGVDQGASWAWNFWQSHDVSLTSGTNKQQVISEIGWPSQGGKDCGGSSTCTDSTPGAVAGISQMNSFMNSWVCQALSNSTQYFWFEAYDEPWKIQYDTPGQAWEDHWGLFDVNRNLKNGVNIPSCGGQTVKVGGYP